MNYEQAQKPAQKPAHGHTKTQHTHLQQHLHTPKHARTCTLTQKHTYNRKRTEKAQAQADTYELGTRAHTHDINIKNQKHATRTRTRTRAYLLACVSASQTRRTDWLNISTYTLHFCHPTHRVPSWTGTTKCHSIFRGCFIENQASH